METVQTQCQIQLELARVTLSTRLRTDGSSAEGRAMNHTDKEMEQQLAIRLGRVERALQRLAAGQFGLCQACRKPIDAERLLALPFVDTCIDCQRAAEHKTFWRFRNATSITH